MQQDRRKKIANYLNLFYLPLKNQMDTSEAVSYQRLRKFVGFLGFLLPFCLSAGAVIFGECRDIQSSISGYYHTVMRDVFVGGICVVAFFLFAYDGYGVADKTASNLASCFALGVAFFPTDPIPPFDRCRLEPFEGHSLVGTVHYIAAAGFFLTLTYFCLFLFTRKNPSGKCTPQKLSRNLIFRICGMIMLSCIALLAIYFCFFQDDPPLDRFKPVFWLETIALLAFGVSWLIKGELILADRGLADTFCKAEDPLSDQVQ